MKLARPEDEVASLEVNWPRLKMNWPSLQTKWATLKVTWPSLKVRWPSLKSHARDCGEGKGRDGLPHSHRGECQPRLAEEGDGIQKFAPGSTATMRLAHRGASLAQGREARPTPAWASRRRVENPLLASSCLRHTHIATIKISQRCIGVASVTRIQREIVRKCHIRCHTVTLVSTHAARRARTRAYECHSAESDCHSGNDRVGSQVNRSCFLPTTRNRRSET